MGIETTDRELLYWLATDPAAFEVFYRRHVDRVIGYTTRRVRDPADVADLVAATFVTVLTSAQSYDPERGEPTAWLLGITGRLIASGARRAERESAATARIAGRRLIDADDIQRLEERIDATRSSEAITQALDRLKPRFREALLLVGEGGLTPTEAARVLGVSAATFRMRLSAARRALAKALHANAGQTTAQRTDTRQATARPATARPATDRPATDRPAEPGQTSAAPAKPRHAKAPPAEGRNPIADKRLLTATRTLNEVTP
jgi:RNA polymerase sigma factor (sigma-70 family)